MHRINWLSMDTVLNDTKSMEINTAGLVGRAVEVTAN